MLRLDQARARVLACARGARDVVVRITTPEPGFACVAPPPPDPKTGATTALSSAAAEILKRDAAMREELFRVIALTRAAMERMGATAEEVDRALTEVSKGQERLARGFEALSETMTRPVRPIYDARGKLVGAARDK